VDVPKVRGSSGTGGLSSLGLLAPVDCIPHILVSQCSNAIQIPVPGDSTANIRKRIWGCSYTCES
jgi:hypothetical protein